MTRDCLFLTAKCSCASLEEMYDLTVDFAGEVH